MESGRAEDTFEKFSSIGVKYVAVLLAKETAEEYARLSEIVTERTQEVTEERKGRRLVPT